MKHWLIKLIKTSETIICGHENSDYLVDGDKVLVMTKYGYDLGTVLGAMKGGSCSSQTVELDFKLASDSDIQNYKANGAKEAEAKRLCVDQVEHLGLEMKIVGVHFTLFDEKIVFFFTADHRVDFRELVRNLVSIFHMRIELRQIGVRDEARMVGGRGVCGRVLCCHGVNDQLPAVSIKMAKSQNLSINSMKISGPCGRLLCCLAFEHEAYQAERAQLPHEGSTVYFPVEGTKGRVIEINIPKKAVQVITDGGERCYIAACRLVRSRERKGQWEVAEAGTCGTQRESCDRDQVELSR